MDALLKNIVKCYNVARQNRNSRQAMTKPPTPLRPSAPQGGAGMRRRRTTSIRLLSLGVGHRLLGAALIVAALWGAFFLTTSTPGWL